jgi:hypothetical protein
MSEAETNSAICVAVRKAQSRRAPRSALTYLERHKAFLMRAEGHSFLYIASVMRISPTRLRREMEEHGVSTKGWCIPGHSPRPASKP